MANPRKRRLLRKMRLEVHEKSLIQQEELQEIKTEEHDKEVELENETTKEEVVIAEVEEIKEVKKSVPVKSNLKKKK